MARVFQTHPETFFRKNHAHLLAGYLFHLLILKENLSSQELLPCGLIFCKN
jgi:hypothetical protein